MNTRIKAIIASSLLLATALPFAACARRKAPEAKLLPTAEPAIVDIKPTESETTPAAVEEKMPIQIPETAPAKMQLETLVETKETKQKDETKKTTKKTTKKATKKTKKNDKKSDKKSNKETTAPKFTYGTSRYTAKNFNITVHIRNNNTVEVSVVNNCPTKSDKSYFVYEFSGKINPDTGLFTYSNGSIRSVVDTNMRQERVMYRNNASGYMTFNGNSLTWFDGALHRGDDVTFKKG